MSECEIREGYIIAASISPSDMATLSQRVRTTNSKTSPVSYQNHKYSESKLCIHTKNSLFIINLHDNRHVNLFNFLI